MEVAPLAQIGCPSYMHKTLSLPLSEENHVISMVLARASAITLRTCLSDRICHFLTTNLSDVRREDRFFSIFANSTSIFILA